ncbi:MAG: endonuclease/exonuclease/phosphatase family protein [Pseudomonadota bacterium]
MSSTTLSRRQQRQQSLSAEGIRERARRPWRWRSECVGAISVGFVALLGVVLLPHLFRHTLLIHLDQARLHAGVGILACGLVFAIFGARLRAFLSAVIGVVILGTVGFFFVSMQLPMAADRDPELTLVSFNVLGVNPRGEEIARYLVDTAPDIALILENEPLHDQTALLTPVFPFTAGCVDGGRCDMAVHSRYPLRDIEVLPFFTTEGRLIRARIDLPGRDVTLLAAHLTKPYHGAWHGLQMDILVDQLARIEGPVILAGDFNSQAFVPAFREHLIEASGMRLISGMRPTWPALEAGPLSYAGFAIDHVLARGDVVPISADRIDDPMGSNHHGLITQFDLDGQ